MNQPPPPRHRASAVWSALVVTAVSMAVIFSMLAAAYVGGEAANTVVEPATPSIQQAAVTRQSAQVSARIAAGAHDFVRFGCDQCHGLDGKGGVSPVVPSLTSIGPSLSEIQLTSIINTGMGITKDPTKPYMPVFHGIISTPQIAAIVAYLRAGLPAVSAATPIPIPKGQGAAVAGAIDFTNFGCINCHGPNGMGGVPNPQSPDTTIPPLGTRAFFQQFNTDQKIRHLIVTGSVIGHYPIVDMPHWGGILTPTQITALIAYIDTLKRAQNGKTTFRPSPHG
jgi:mono/diheme cytochrome c family protein